MQADTLSTNDDQPDHHGAQAPHQLDDQAPHRGDHPLHLTIAEYAEHVGLSQSTIRRKIRRGELAAELVEGPYGQEYRIWLGDQSVRRDQGDWPPPGDQGGHHGDQSSYQPAEGLGELVALLREKDQTILELAGRCGFYQSEIQHLHAQLEDARAQIALLSAPAAAAADSPDTPHGTPPHLAPISAIADMPADQAQVETANRSAPEQNGPNLTSYERESRPWWRRWLGW